MKFTVVGFLEALYTAIFSFIHNAAEEKRRLVEILAIEQGNPKVLTMDVLCAALEQLQMASNELSQKAVDFSITQPQSIEQIVHALVEIHLNRRDGTTFGLQEALQHYPTCRRCSEWLLNVVVGAFLQVVMDGTDALEAIRRSTEAYEFDNDELEAINLSTDQYHRVLEELGTMSNALGQHFIEVLATLFPYEGPQVEDAELERTIAQFLEDHADDIGSQPPN